MADLTLRISAVDRNTVGLARIGLPPLVGESRISISRAATLGGECLANAYSSILELSSEVFCIANSSLSSLLVDDKFSIRTFDSDGRASWSCTTDRPAPRAQARSSLGTCQAAKALLIQIRTIRNHATLDLKPALTCPCFIAIRLAAGGADRNPKKPRANLEIRLIAAV
jgi:hypothetical protein